ncbi:hypothetical protein [Actinoplanes siamensis]|uniref:Uncharacterized protein n=1 Tax=Actinoplanes siamensis TaxID=1223317 RepID=A0A919NEH5_9ACTN|nr:hypothetical protein [Actinoplanes siamensis]GIF09792.1 hypothetical protein Asi03nite_73300 [Actinoplanes siamensis]
MFEHVPRAGVEGDIDNEKFKLKTRDCAAAERTDRSLAPFLTGLIQIRKQNPTLRWPRNMSFHEIDNGSLLSSGREQQQHGSRGGPCQRRQRAVGQHHAEHAGAGDGLPRAVHSGRPDHR